MILVRIVKPGTPSVQEMFQQKKESSFEYIDDRSKNLGFIRKKFQKESTVFRLRVDKGGFFQGEGCSMKIKREGEFVYVMIKARERLNKDELARLFVQLQIPANDLTISFVKIYDSPYIGYIYRSDDVQRQRQFCRVLHNIVSGWEQRYLSRR